jgi:cytochrome c-type biogenesis protein CcmF
VPYFNAVFIPIMLPAVVLMAIFPFVRWKKDTLKRVSSHLRLHWLGILALILIARIFVTDNIFVLIAIGLFIWMLVHVMVLLIARMRSKSVFSFAFIGMLIAHLGIAVFTLGATVTTQMGIEKDIKMSFGETQNIAGYDFVFNGVNRYQRDNYAGFMGDITVFKDGKEITTLMPEKRYYQSGMPMTEASIHPSLARDLYVALGEELVENSWSVRIYYKPLVRWIWLGGLMIALGALFAAIDRRYFLRAKS